MAKIGISVLWHDHPETIISFYNNLKFAMMRHSFEVCISLSPNIKSDYVKEIFHETIPDNLKLVDVKASRKKYTSDILGGHLQNFEALSLKKMDFFIPLASNCMFIRPLPYEIGNKEVQNRSEFKSVFQNKTNTWPTEECMKRSSDFVEYCKSNEIAIIKQLHEGVIIPFDFLKHNLKTIKRLMPQGEKVNFDQYPVEEYIIPTLFNHEFGCLPRQFLHYDWNPNVGGIKKLIKSGSDASHGLKRVSRAPDSEIRSAIQNIYSSPGEYPNPILIQDYSALFSVSKKFDFVYSKSQGLFQRDYSGIIKDNYPIEVPKTGFYERGMRYVGGEITPSQIKKFDELSYDKACVVYSNLYGIKNYEHFILDVVPKIWVIWKYFRNELNNYHFIVQKSKFSDLCMEILDIFDIEADKIILIETDTVVKIRQGLVYTSFFTHPFNLAASEFLLDFRNQIESKSKHVFNAGKKKKIYLSRAETENTGHSRRIINSNELDSLLSEFDFEKVIVGGLSLIEKFELLSHTSVLISEIGANCLNILLAEDIGNLITIGHNKWEKRFYNDVFKILNPQSDENIIWGQTEPIDYDPFSDNRGVNVPWNADLASLSKLLRTLEKN